MKKRLEFLGILTSLIVIMIFSLKVYEIFRKDSDIE